MAEALDGGVRGQGIEPRNTFSRDAAPVSVVRRQIVRQIVDRHVMRRQIGKHPAGKIVDRHVMRRQIVRSWTGT